MIKRIRKPKLIADWKQVLTKTLAVKFVIISGICSVGEIIIAYYPDLLPRGAMAGLSGTFALLGLISRFYMQKQFEDDDGDQR